MESFKVAIIGAGKPRGTEGATGFGMSHQHMFGYAKTGRCKLVAVADISRENAEGFVKDHDPSAKIYADYKEMMAAEKPDIVSVSLWPHMHAKVVCDVAEHAPRAIHCEKPMDLHWDASLKMHEVCKKRGIQLTFNHQRRFNRPFQKLKSMLDEGAIGRVLRMEAAWHNLADSGTHWLDMMFFFNGDLPAQWVLGQIEARGAKKVFGALQETQSIVTFRFANDVRATMYGGLAHADLGCMIRVTGTEGALEILADAPWLRMRRYGNGVTDLDPGESIHVGVSNVRAVQDLVDCIGTDKKPQLSSDNAIRATEVIFAAYESSRRRGRVDLPLAPGPSALLSMVEAGQISTES